VQVRHAGGHLGQHLPELVPVGGGVAPPEEHGREGALAQLGDEVVRLDLPRPTERERERGSVVRGGAAAAAAATTATAAGGAGGCAACACAACAAAAATTRWGASAEYNPSKAATENPTATAPLPAPTPLALALARYRYRYRICRRSGVRVSRCWGKIVAVTGGFDCDTVEQDWAANART
jgi:hypothetical protein